jgi:polyhydroxyalkanoate synthase
MSSFSEDKNIKALKTQYENMEKFFETVLIEPEPMVGLTPKEIVWKKNKAKLYHYKTVSKGSYKTPILIVYALINKPYILDLTPNDSLIEHLVSKGHDVYLLDWGIPDYEDKGLKIENYIHDYIHRACKKVLKHSNSSDLTLFGYCMGGTFSTIYTSLYSSMPIRNLVLLTTPIDFSGGGLFTNLVDEKYFHLDRLVDTVGLIPGEFIDIGSRLLSPYGSYIGTYENLYQQIESNKSTLKWKLMNKWTNDNIPLVGETYRQWIREFYQQNNLFNDHLILNGDPVHLSNITSDVLFIAGETDNIVQKHQILNGIEKFTNAKTSLLVVPGGHVSVVIGDKARNNTYPYLVDWLGSRSN